MIRNRRINVFIILLGIFFFPAGCGAGKEPDAESEDAVLIYEDALGNRIEFTKQEQSKIAEGTMKVAVLNGSLEEIWS